MHGKWMIRAGLFAAAMAGLSVEARAQADSRGFVRTLPSQMEWQDAEGAPTAILAGDPSKPGLYVMRIRFPPHVFSRPHWHSTDRHVVVLKGTWYMGIGDTFDPSKAVAVPVGGYAKHPAGAAHFDGAKDEEVELQITGMGPMTTTIVNKDDAMFGPEK